MAVIEYDLKAERIASKRCSTRIAIIAVLLAIVIVVAIVGSLLLYHHQLWPFSNQQQPEESPPAKRELDIAFLKHREDIFLVAPGVGGTPFSVALNESDRDDLSLESVVRHVANYEFRMQMKRGRDRKLSAAQEKIIPDDVERLMWNAPVDSKFVIKVFPNGNEILYNGLITKVDPENSQDYRLWEELFETLANARYTLLDLTSAEAEIISSDLHDLQ